MLDDVAVIDEIQMIRDPQRGWAWTRALLGKIRSCIRYFCYFCYQGLQAKEIHICGENSTRELIEELLVTTGDDEVEIREYKRLTKLNYLEQLALTLVENA